MHTKLTHLPGTNYASLSDQQEHTVRDCTIASFIVTVVAIALAAALAVSL